MSQRLLYNTKWLCCLIALHAGSFWGQARSVTVRSPPSNPSTIEAQAKFFQDFFSVQLSPYKIEFGHVCEDPNTWEQRYEKKDFKNHRDMGKVRWGDKKGGYGEHYWDLNHAGHGNDDGYDGDDGSYHESSNDPYDEPSEHSPTYGDDYDPEKASYEESGRAKRAHPKIKIDKKHQKQAETYDDETKAQKQKRKNKEALETAATEHDEEYSDEYDDESYEKPKPKNTQHRKESNQEYTKHSQHRKESSKNTNQETKEEKQEPKEKKQFVLVVSHKDDTENQKQTQYQPQYNQRQPEPSPYLPKKQPELSQYLPKPEHQYVPYEGGAGVRQHQPEVSAATTVPRLFLEPSTGHVVDRATGQAYVLQPIAAPNYN